MLRWFGIAMFGIAVTTIVCIELMSHLFSSAINSYTHPSLPPNTQPPPAVVKTFDNLTTSEFNATFPQVSSDRVKGSNVNISQPLHLMGEAWFGYAQHFNDARIGREHPQPMEAYELMSPTDSPGQVCSTGDSTAYPQPLVSPMYCRIKAGQQATPQTADVVLPAGFTQELQDYARLHGEREGWEVAAMVAGLEYAQHLRADLPGAGMQWPEIAAQNDPFDHCMAGVSLRAVFPGDISESQLRSLFPELDQLASKPDGNPEDSYQKLLDGFYGGKPAVCPVA